MLNYKLALPILLLNSYLFSSNIDLELENYLNKGAKTTLIKADRLKTYYLNSKKSYWLDENGLKNISLEFINLVKNDPVYKPKANELFNINTLESKISSLDKDSQNYNKELLDIEILLTEIYDKYSGFLLRGSIKWDEFQKKLKEVRLKDIDVQWDRVFVKNDTKKILEDMISSNNIEVIQEKLDTNYPHKKELAKSIDNLEKIIEAGDYIKLPAFKTLRLGDNGDNVKILRDRLFQSNDLQKTCQNSVNIGNIVTNNIETEQDSKKEKDETKEETFSQTIPCEEYFDEDLKEAVVSFQKQHGLLSDGIVGASTQAFLNKSAKEKIKQIRLNIERMRWLPRDFGEKYLIVNIPEYNLKMIENNEIKLDMAVIVGDVKFPTPIFSDKMSYIVLNPAWNIPSSIIKKELIPKLVKDPSYLASQGIDIYAGWDSESGKMDTKEIIDSLILEDGAGLSSFRMAQSPGSKNPLGKMKFMFPNKHSVYLHDTPNKYLFANARRAYSHGCIRLSKPNDLLDILSSDNQNIEKSKINEIFNDKKEKALNLNNKLPIHIIYLTSWVDKDGVLQFREDIYNYDKLQKEFIY